MKINSNTLSTWHLIKKKLKLNLPNKFCYVIVYQKMYLLQLDPLYIKDLFAKFQIQKWVEKYFKEWASGELKWNFGEEMTNKSLSDL